MAEPSGRISSVTANDAYTAASDSIACSDGKNSLPITGATNSRINRSNRSSAHPMHEAVTAPSTCRLFAAAGIAPCDTLSFASTSIVVSIYF